MKSGIRNIKQLRGGDIFSCRVCVLQLVREPKDHLQPDCPGPHIDQVATIHELPNYNRSRLLYYTISQPFRRVLGQDNNEVLQRCLIRC